MENILLVETANSLKNIKTLYNTHQIKKGRKTRTVNAPIAELKTALSAFNKGLTKLYADELEKRGLDEIAQAYLPGKSIKTNAEIHRNSPVLIKFDFKGFYDCVRWGYYCQYLYRLEPKIEAQKKLVKRLIVDPKTNGLIQGSPVSGALAGLAMLPFWKKLKDKLPPGTVFTQYSDDLVLSMPNTESMPEHFNIKSMERLITESLHETGLKFNLNRLKTCTQKKQYRKVTGITINPENKPTLKRKDYRFLRMLLYQLEHDIELESILEKHGFEDVSVLQGKISYWRSIDCTGKIEKLISKYKKAMQILQQKE